MPEEEKKREVVDRPEPVDDLVTTAHTLRAGERELAYTATTGRIVLRQEVHTDDKFEGHQPKAEVFLTAYTLNGADAAERPVMFAFNGGPGSSGGWLRLGVLRARRGVRGGGGAPGAPPEPPVGQRENPPAPPPPVFIRTPVPRGL